MVQSLSGGICSLVKPAGDGPLPGRVIGNRLADAENELCLALLRVGAYFSIGNLCASGLGVFPPTSYQKDLSEDVTLFSVLMG